MRKITPKENAKGIDVGFEGIRFLTKDFGSEPWQRPAHCLCPRVVHKLCHPKITHFYPPILRH